VSIYWEPCGDEACYDDGVSYACGLCGRREMAWMSEQEVRRHWTWDGPRANLWPRWFQGLV
jgi:hypothetical protein